VTHVSRLSLLLGTAKGCCILGSEFSCATTTIFGQPSSKSPPPALRNPSSTAHATLHRCTAGTHVVNASRIGPNNSIACGKRRPLHKMRRLSRSMTLAAVVKLTSRKDQSSHVLFSPAPNARNYMIASQLGRWLHYVSTPLLSFLCVETRGTRA
jgi:hypothetical protein